MIKDFRQQNITYKTFRTIFNRETCPNLESVIIRDPDKELEDICFANKSQTIHDDRIIEDIVFDVVELPKPLRGLGVRATIYLKSQLKEGTLVENRKCDSFCEGCCDTCSKQYVCWE